MGHLVLTIYALLRRDNLSGAQPLHFCGRHPADGGQIAPVLILLPANNNPIVKLAN
jgi:hypothetical protein